MPDGIRIPYRIRSRLPLWLLKRLYPPRSPMLALPSREMTADLLAGLGRVLVVAPHQDDETLGCGGLMALLRRAGRPVHVLFVTDGGASHPNSRTHPPEELARLRAVEAKAALRVLGIEEGEATFLGLPDGRLPFPGDRGFDGAVAAASRFLAGRRFDTVLLPWRRDSSRDHRAVWHVLRAALPQAEPPRVLEYPVWAWTQDRDAPVPGEVTTWRLDVGPVLGVKRRAIACHRSQLGGVVKDDPAAFRLAQDVLVHFDRPWELFFEGADRRPGRAA